MALNRKNPLKNLSFYTFKHPQCNCGRSNHSGVYVTQPSQQLRFSKYFSFEQASPVNGSKVLPSLVLFAVAIYAAGNEETEKKSIQEDNNDIAALLAKGLHMQRTKSKLEEAEKIYIEALHIALSRDNRSIIATVQDLLANLALQTNQLAKAEVLFRNVIQNLLATGKMENDPSVLEISLKLATIYAGLGNLDFADQGYVWVIETSHKNVTEMKSLDLNEEINKKAYDNQLALLGMTLDSYGRFLLANGKMEDALRVTREALSISNEMFGEKDIRTLVLYNDIGTILHQMGHIDEAVEIIEKSITISTKDKRIANHSDLAVFWVNLGNIYSEIGKNDKSVKGC